MKNIVKVTRLIDSKIRLYEIPEAMNIEAEKLVKISTHYGGNTYGVTLCDSFTVTDDEARKIEIALNLHTGALDRLMRVEAVCEEQPVDWPVDETEDETEEKEEE